MNMNASTATERIVSSMDPRELCIKLYDHYESKEQVSHYYGVLAIYGLCLAAEERDDNGELLERCKEILSRFPEKILHAPYNFPSYRIGGIPRAYMYYRGYMTDERTKRLVAHYAEEMMLACRDDKGIICQYYRPAMQQIWIDVAMPVTPYLLFAGLAFNEQDWIDEAVNQTILHYDELLNPDNGLLHQCRNFVGPGKFSEDHWGRGNGWGFIALTELLQHLPADSPHRAKIEKYFKNHAAAMLPHQSQRGLWRQEIPLETAWEESSGTGLILYGYGAGLRLGLLDEATYRPAFDLGIKALREYCINDDFSTELSCEGCLCPGLGERSGTVEAYVEDKHCHRDEHHSFGPFMFALIEEHRAKNL